MSNETINQSYLKFQNGIKLHQFLVDVTSKTFEEMEAQYLIPQSTLTLRSNFNHNSSRPYHAIYTSKNLTGNHVVLFKQTGLDSTHWDLIGDLESATYIDHNIANRTPVRYMVSINPQSGTINEYTTPFQKPNWGKWSIENIFEDLDTGLYYTDGNIYLFTNNISSGSITTNVSVNKYDTLGKYGRVFKTDKQYESGSVSCLFGNFEVAQNIPLSGNFVEREVLETETEDTYLNPTGSKYLNPDTYGSYIIRLYNNDLDNYYRYVSNSGWIKLTSSYQYLESADKVRKWLDFANDGNLKLLRDNQGNKWIVSITENISREYNDSANLYPTTISFSWQEVMNSDDINIVELQR